MATAGKNVWVFIRAESFVLSTRRTLCTPWPRGRTRLLTGSFPRTEKVSENDRIRRKCLGLPLLRPTTGGNFIDRIEVEVIAIRVYIHLESGRLVEKCRGASPNIMRHPWLMKACFVLCFN